MKNLRLTLVLTLLVSFADSAMIQAQTCTFSASANQMEPIAYYPFNGNAQDASGNGNDGRLIQGVRLTEDRFGNPCSAMEFNGEDGYISVPSSTSLNTPRDGLTIAAWFKISKYSDFADLQWVSVCCKSNQSEETDQHPHYRFQTTKVTFSMSSDFTENWQQEINYDEWYFYTMTYNSRSVKIYLNAEQVMDFAYYKTLVPNNAPLEIGRDVPGVMEYFAGKLDDIRLYNRPLSETEIITLYQDESTKAPRSNPCPKTASTTPTPPPETQKTEQVNIDYQHTVKVKSRQITVYLYDHEKNDGDIVSINFNGEWVLDKYKLKNKKKKLSRNKHLKLDLMPGQDYYLISKAWNLGNIPPNTLTLEIDDGVSPTTQVVSINSRIGRSGAIRIRCEP